MDARNGNILWTYQAPGAVKASPSLSGGVLYFGDYSGHLQAVSEQTGRRLWISGSEGALLGSGNFYSTPAVVYGRVFLGNTDGRVYAYDASTGKLDWAVQTGAYVYASPAVTNAPGIGPTIYLGSYDGTFYALNAQSGRIAWRFNAGEKISGSATIVGRTVYFADLGQRRTYGLGVSTGRVSFEKGAGGFDPVISDGQHIYLTGYTGLFALAPRSAPPPAASARRAAARSREAERPRQRETGGHRHRGTLGSGYERPAAGCFSHAARSLHEREVAGVMHAHEDSPRRVGPQREGVVAQRGQPPGAAQQRRCAAHGVYAPVRAGEHLAQVRKPGSDQPPLLRARVIQGRVGQRHVAHRLLPQPALVP